MKLFKTTAIAVMCLASSAQLSAQEVSFKLGGETNSKLIKQSELQNFAAGGNSYFVTKYRTTTSTAYYIESYSSSGSAGMQTQLDIPVGVMGNSYGIEGVLGLGDQAYVLVEHFSKANGNLSLSVRPIESSGKVSSTDTELMAITAGKMMNSGFYRHSVSPDQNTLLIAGQAPYSKDESAKLKLALYDKNLKSIVSTDISLPGEDTKNKGLAVRVANDGSVYIIKNTSSKNGEIVLQAYYVDVKSGTIKDYALELNEPSYIKSYETAISDQHELIIAGIYHNRAKLTVGEPKMHGVFFFTNKNKEEKLMTSFPLDSPVENLITRKVLVNGNTVFVAAEQFKEERLSQPASAAGTAAAFDYQYNFTHKNEYVIGIDADGKRKFELNIPRNLTARNFDHQYVSAYFISNGKFTLVYNDERSKFTTLSGHASLIPSVVQISNDGLMLPGVALIDKNKLPYEYILYTSKYVQTADGQINFLLGKNDESKFVMLLIK